MLFKIRSRNNKILTCLLVFVGSVQYSVSSSHPIAFCEESMSVPIRNAKLQENGHLLDETYENTVEYPVGTFWKSSEGNGNDTSPQYRGCPCLLEHPCIPKCCPQGLVRKGVHCIALIVPFWIDVKAKADLTPVRVQADEMFTVLHRDPFHSDHPECSPETIEYDEGNFYIQSKDGHLVVDDGVYGPERFCLEYFVEVKGYRAILNGMNSKSGCRPIRRVLWKIDGISSMVSVLFPLASLSVYLATPSMWKYYGRGLPYYFCSSAVAFLSEGIANLGIPLLPQPICITVAYLFMYSSLASFFWLNVMCFDLTFVSRPYSSLDKCEEKRNFKRSLVYSINAWGTPMLLVLASLIVDISPNLVHGAKKPDIGTCLCWFKDVKAETILYDGPIFVTMGITAVYLIIAGLKIYVIKPSASDQNTTNVNYKQRFFLYAGIFNIMATYKVVQLICWVYDSDISMCITYIVYAFQGPLIFVVFVWRDKIKNDLLKRFFPKKYNCRVTSISSYRLEETDCEDKDVSRS